ncbi:MAG: Glycosyl transferase, family 2 [uncultured bacterium]|nr:MAG: Glycosyl transferase, family 2 [uncultured bacterium]
MNNSKITTLLATYKRPRELSRAVLSVLNQTYKNLQIAIFDDASSDETEETIRKLQKEDTRIKYYCHPQNIGALANFKFTFTDIETPYFSILSDDDILDPKFYEKAISILETNPDIMFIILDSLAIDKDCNLVDEFVPNNKLKFYRDNNRFDALIKREIPNDWTSMVFRREVANIYLKMQDNYDISSDMRFLLIAVARYKFAYLSQIGSYFTMHSESISSNRQFDYFHRITQLSRYVEIMHDQDVAQEIKNDIKRKMKKMVKNQFSYEPQLKRAIKYHCSNQTSRIDIAYEIKERRALGMRLIPVIIQLLFQNKLSKLLIRFFFLKILKRKELKFRKRTFLLQNSFYKNEFAYIHAINKQCETYFF